MCPFLGPYFNESNFLRFPNANIREKALLILTEINIGSIWSQMKAVNRFRQFWYILRDVLNILVRISHLSTRYRSIHTKKWEAVGRRGWLALSREILKVLGASDAHENMQTIGFLAKRRLSGIWKHESECPSVLPTQHKSCVHEDCHHLAHKHDGVSYLIYVCYTSIPWTSRVFKSTHLESARLEEMPT